MNNKHLLIVSLALIVSVTLNVVGGFFIFAGVQSVEELPLGQALPATASPRGQYAVRTSNVPAVLQRTSSANTAARRVKN